MIDWLSHLHTLTAIPGISGHEEAIAAYMAESLRPYASEVKIDPIYNVIARIGSGKGKKIAICAHIDTIGMMVKSASINGLRVVRIGGINYKALPGTRVRVHTQAGDLAGLVDVRSAHQARAGDEAIRTDDDVWVYTGSNASGIEITTPITYMPEVLALANGFIVSPYLDDRAGCAVLLALAEWLHSEPSAHTVYLIGTVQEETNAIAAQAALAAVKPDMAIFVDGTVSYDTPETIGRGETRLGSGAVLTAFLYISGIGSWHAHPRLRQHLKTIAVREGIHFQQDAVHGLMADSRAAIPLAIPSAVVGIPMRGKHSPAEVVNSADLDSALMMIHAALLDSMEF